jgi:methionyl aminopeptidase
MTVSIKNETELDAMRLAGALASQVLNHITHYIRAGIETAELDQLCHDFITGDLSAIPAPLNYRGFPKSICTSINHVVCHGVPSAKKLKNGDIINIDITVIKNGFHGDTSRMFFVGEPTFLAHRLVTCSYDAMVAGIRQVKSGTRLGDIGHAIQSHAEKNNFTVVREYCGHGIGRGFHEEPQVLHYGIAGTGAELRSGMTLTIEPMINAGQYPTRLLPDGWTVVTRDHSLSAQWEHTIAVTDCGYEVLTLAPGESI